MRPDQRGQAPVVLWSEDVGPAGFGQDVLDHQSVYEHERGLQDVQAQHGHPGFVAAVGVRGFARMMTELQGERLEEWITTIEQDTLAPLASFARFLRRDQDAVCAGLTLEHSSGKVEGTVNKIKMLKRQMFGRANFDLLRIRVLTA